MTQDSRLWLHFADKFTAKNLRAAACAFFFLYCAPIPAAHAEILPFFSSAAKPPSSRTLFIQAARAYIGTPYRTGGTSADGMDCSGLVYQAALDGPGTPLPRTVSSLASRATRIRDAAREPGDLLFFNTTGRLSHVGIYLGGGTFVHAASDGPRTGVIISDLSEEYWKRTYSFAGRVFNAEDIRIPDGEKIPIPSINPFPFAGTLGIRLNYTGGALWDFMPGELPVRGGMFLAEASWMKGVGFYPGIAAGVSGDSRSGSLSIPLLVSIMSPEGFRFFMGTQLHLFSDTSLDRSPQFPGLLGVSWNSKPVRVAGQNVRFYQSAEYSWFPGETFGMGFRFNTGLTLSCDI